MDVTVAFKNAEALAGLQPALDHLKDDDASLMREIRLGLGTVSQALEDGLAALNELQSDARIADGTLKQALRLLYSDTDPTRGIRMDKFVFVVAKTGDRDYLVLVPNPNFPQGLLVVLGTVSESNRAWTITESGLSGRPLP